MQYRIIHYSALLNLGNYNNERIGFTVRVDEEESPEEVIDALRQKVREVGGKNAEEIYRALAKGERELRVLNKQIEKAAESWNRTAEFLRAQGLKPEAPTMPEFINLLPQAKDEYVESVEGEIYSYSRDEDDFDFEES